MASEDTKNINFSQEDLTQRRRDAKNAGDEEKKKKFLNQILYYPKAQRHNSELTNNNSAFSVPLRLCVSFFVIFCFLSCKTAPVIPEIPQDENFLLLESGASAYILADAKQARPIIDLLPIKELNNNETKMMLDRTDFLAAAIFPQTSGRRFQIAARGNYPSSQANLAFSLSKEWQNKSSQAGGSYWHSSANKISIAMNNKQAFAVSSLADEPLDPITSSHGIEVPDGFNDFRKGSILSCWTENPAPAINSILNNAGVPIQFPIQKLFINLLSAGEKYEALIRLYFENQSYARGTAAILSLITGFAPDNSKSIIISTFFANAPVLNEKTLDIKTAALSEEEITRLLNLFPFP